MRNLIFLFTLLLSFSYAQTTQGQCTVEAFPADTVTFTCGNEIEIQLSAFGNSGNYAINNDFNSGTPGAGWDGTLAATYTNPCVDSPDSSIYMWMGDATPQPRILTTQSFDLSTGGTICYEMRYAVQGEPAPCEGPDEPHEGVYLQYSIDNGATWVTIHYLDPIGGFDPIITSWQQYCYGIPPAAQTTNTKIRWFQDATSGAEYDHWGLDNVFISINDPSYSYNWEHNGFTGAEPPVVNVNSDTTFVVHYGNGIDDECSDTVVVQTVPPVFLVTSTPDTSICGDGCINLDATADIVVRPFSQPTFTNNEFQPLLPLGQPTIIPVATGGVGVEVVEAGTIESVCLNVNNPAFPGFPVDLSTFNIVLECPEGATVTLAATGDLSGASLSNTCFSDAGAPLSSGTPPFTGTFAPSSGSLDDFIGCSTNGVWKITITNSNFAAFGFFNSWSITFNVPEISYQGVYEWSPTAGLDDPSSLNPLACPTNTTTYELMVRDSFDCATTTHEVTVGIIDPTQLSVDATITDANCAAADGQVSLVVNGSSGNETVVWEDGTTGLILANVDSGIYQVTITDGCVLDTAIAVGSQPSQLSVIADITKANCGSEDGEAHLTVNGSSGNETITWQDGTTGPTLSNIATGIYTVSIDDGCVLDTFITVGVLGGPLIDSVLVTQPQLEEADGTLEILATGGTAPLEYSLDGADFQGTNVFTELDSGMYTLTVRDAFGCQDSINFYLEKFSEVRIPSIFSPNSNVANNNTFMVQGMIEPEIKIFDRWGFKIYESAAYTNNWNGDKHATGVYYYVIVDKADGQAYTGYVHLVR